MVIWTETREAINRARRAGVDATEPGTHPAIRELVAIDAAMLDLCEHLRDVAACTDLDGMVAEIDALTRGLKR